MSARMEEFLHTVARLETLGDRWRLLSKYEQDVEFGDDFEFFTTVAGPSYWEEDAKVLYRLIEQARELVGKEK